MSTASAGGASESSPGREPGVNRPIKEAPAGAKDPWLLSPLPGLIHSSVVFPGLTPGATFFRPSRPRTTGPPQRSGFEPECARPRAQKRSTFQRVEPCPSALSVRIFLRPGQAHSAWFMGSLHDMLTAHWDLEPLKVSRRFRLTADFFPIRGRSESAGGFKAFGALSEFPLEKRVEFSISRASLCQMILAR